MKDLTVPERVNAYLNKHSAWRDQLMAAREVLQGTELTEGIKWGGPAWSLDGRVLIGLAAYTHHCAIWFHHGVYLQDKAQRLLNAQESTRGMRQWRLHDQEALDVALFRVYVDETIVNERAGKRLKPRTATERPELEMPVELAERLAADKALKTAFSKLSPGRAREFIAHVGSAKRATTRVSRAEKSVPLIRAGKGLNDKYRGD